MTRISSRRHRQPLSSRPWLGLVLSVGLCATTLPVAAQDAPPRWLNPPQPGMFPGFAGLIKVNGRVTLRCRVARQGLPEDCEVLEAIPDSLGFEDAALRAAATGVASPRIVNGQAVPAEIQFTVRFVHVLSEDGGDGSPYLGPAVSPRAIELGRRIARENEVEIVRDISDSMLEGLAPDRRAIVEPWLYELRILDAEILIDDYGIMLARLTSEADLEASAAAGTPLNRGVPTEEEWDAVSVDLVHPGYEARWTRLRERYCAMWSCGLQD